MAGNRAQYNHFLHHMREREREGERELELNFLNFTRRERESKWIELCKGCFMPF